MPLPFIYFCLTIAVIGFAAILEHFGLPSFDPMTLFLVVIIMLLAVIMQRQAKGVTSITRNQQKIYDILIKKLNNIDANITDNNQ